MCVYAVHQFIKIKRSSIASPICVLRLYCIFIPYGREIRWTENDGKTENKSVLLKRNFKLKHNVKTFVTKILPYKSGTSRDCSGIVLHLNGGHRLVCWIWRWLSTYVRICIGLPRNISSILIKIVQNSATKIVFNCINFHSQFDALVALDSTYCMRKACNIGLVKWMKNPFDIVDSRKNWQILVVQLDDAWLS